ncbi:hypothetical protein PIB30_063970 [Stylosanthes scabra]|uniref:Endonuclease/exonuclease/phosphatase n=1 Tax=Stylosanthes scabra TaxID=79078 RepID=A0ABU6QM89_9FABA|nr:hypothetical protein [Stylosanthes scabra]
MSAVREMVEKNEIRSLALVETKACMMKDYEIKRLWGSINFKWELVEADRNSGGIICVWEKIIAQVARKMIWEEILHEKNRTGLPAIVFGDFNEVLRPDERSRGKGNSMGMRDY